MLDLGISWHLASVSYDYWLVNCSINGFFYCELSITASNGRECFQLIVLGKVSNGWKS